VLNASLKSEVAVESMLCGVDHVLPWRIDTLPLLSTAAQNEAVGHETLVKLGAAVFAAAWATRTGVFHPEPATACAAAVDPQAQRATTLSVLPLGSWRMAALMEPDSPLTVTVPLSAWKSSATALAMLPSLRFTLSSALGSPIGSVLNLKVPFFFTFTSSDQLATPLIPETDPTRSLRSMNPLLLMPP